MDMQFLSAHAAKLQKLKTGRETVKRLMASIYPAGIGEKHYTGVSDSVGRLVVELEDIKAELKSLDEEVNRETVEILNYFRFRGSVDFHCALTIKFIHGGTWKDVAVVLDKAEEAVKTAFYREANELMKKE